MLKKVQKLFNQFQKIFKYFCCFVIAFLFFHPEYIKRPIYQHIYGTPINEKLTISAHSFFADVDDDQPFNYQIGKESLKLHPISKYSVTARVAYIDRYWGTWENFYHGHNEGRVYYNLFAPADLFLIHGELAKLENYGRCKYDHEYRASFYQCPQPINGDDLNNYHIIPATLNVKKALSIILNEDVIYIEGILVDATSAKYPWFSLTTGRRHNMTHKDQFIGGQYTGMCFVLYTTKIIVNNHIYQ